MTARPPATGLGRRARFVAGGAIVVALAGAGWAGSAAAQVDPEPEPTTTAAPTTMAPTTVAPTTIVTTTTPITAAPTTVPTTQRPVVTTVPPTTARAVVVAQASSTTTSSSSSSTTSSTTPGTTTTAGLLVDGTETVTTEPVVETDGLSSATKLRLIVGSLIAIALVVGALTIVYWRRTRPYEWEEWEEDDDDAGPGDDPATTTTSSSSSEPTRSTAAVAAPVAPAGTAAAARVDAAPVADGGRPTPAPEPARGPVVPSLIDPDLRARLTPTATDVSAPAGADVSGAAPSIPTVAVTDPADGAGAAAPRWGTGRVSSDPPVVTGTDPDPDAAFRPPSAGAE